MSTTGDIQIVIGVLDEKIAQLKIELAEAEKIARKVPALYHKLTALNQAKAVFTGETISLALLVKGRKRGTKTPL